MKLVAVSIVKNEADIVEAFVRHTHAWVDHHLVFDHDSTDGTREILGELVREGLPLSLYTDDALGNLQQARSNALTRIAAQEFGADWVLPLDADEFVAAPSRSVLENALGSPAVPQPVSVPLANYYPTERDDAAAINPVLRLKYRASLSGATRKIMVPSSLALDPAVVAGKGSHVLKRGEVVIADRPAPAGIVLAHFALRSLGQQVLRVATAELQKLSRGKAHAGLDVHYRLGFQQLAERPDVFAQSLLSRAATLELDPLRYDGGELKYQAHGEDWVRVCRAMLPFLEKLAVSHGQLVDRLSVSEPAAVDGAPIRALPVASIRRVRGASQPSFEGFEIRSGLGPPEGPFAGAFLPVFRWGMAPETVIAATRERETEARLTLEAVSYWEPQAVTIALNGTVLQRVAFPRVYQKTDIEIPLRLSAGTNTITLSYDRYHASEADPRKLAVIYLSMQLVDA